MGKILPTLTRRIWALCFLLVMVAGVYAAYERLHTVLSSPDPELDLPWSLPAALNVVCGIALAAGGFAVAVTIRVLRIESAQSLLRAGVVSAFLGYLVACLGFVADQTVLKRICAGNSNWTATGATFAINFAFVLFGLSVLAEFAPDVYLPRRWKAFADVLAFIRTPLLCLSVGISLLYQSIVANALRLSTNASRFWASPWLAFLFFMSGTCTALAAGIMAYLHAQRSSPNPPNLKLLEGVRRTLATLLFLYIQARLADLLERGQLPLLHADRVSSLLAIETALFVVPMLVLASQHLPNPAVVYYCGAMILAGFLCNRLNTFITSLEVGGQSPHLPTWHEFAISFSIIAVGLAAFHLLTNRPSGVGFSRVQET